MATYCRHCGTLMNDDALFCPACGEKRSSPQGTPTPVAAGTPNSRTLGKAAANAGAFAAKALAAIAAVALGIATILLLVNLVGHVEGAVRYLGTFDRLVAAIGGALLYLCGVVPILLAGGSCALLAKRIFGTADAGTNIGRFIVCGIVLLAIEVLLWVGGAVFAGASSGVPEMLGTVFTACADNPLGVIIATAIALAALFVLRVRSAAPRNPQATGTQS